MRMKLLAVGALALATWSSTAHASYAVFGNSQGGIIPWSPAVDRDFPKAAAEHCAWYNKVARITSVHRRYGDFIGFSCLFDRRYDPMKNRTPFR